MAYQSYPPYPPPAQQQQAYYAAAPPPPVDPFRAYYASRLTELTFNSRPLIQDLSVQAMAQREQNNWDRMRIVVEEVEAAVLRARPDQKLPLLYLIDSISKNVGPPYTTHLLPPIIPRLYLRTYREVDGVTKSKMEEMIGLWRTASPEGADLYGPSVRESIERDIFGSLGYQGQRREVVSRERVLSLLHATLEGKHRESAARPWDPQPRQQVAVLLQIGELLNSGRVSPAELEQIMGQLRGMGPPPAPAPAPVHQQAYHAPPPARPSMAPPAQVPTPQLPPFPPSIPSYRSPVPPTTAHMPPAQSLPASLQAGTPTTPVPPVATPLPAPKPALAPSSASGIPANVADILRNLNTSGLLSQPRTPDVQAAQVGGKTAMQTYEEEVEALDLRLDSLDLNIPRTIPTAQLPQRCKQCGIRLGEGESVMQAHMDWHFRRNRKAEESAGRGAHRRWLPRAEEWISDLTSNANADAGPSTTSTQAQAQAQAAAGLSAERLQQLSKRWVVTPKDPSKAAMPCPICKEAFKSEWSEEQEEWIWKNAIDVNGTIYHATCRAEQQAARRLAKAVGGGVGRSASPGSLRGTPDMDGRVKAEGGGALLRSPAGGSGQKRKVEVEEAKDAGGEGKRVKVEEQADNEVRVEVDGAGTGMESDAAVAAREEAMGPPEMKAEVEDRTQEAVVGGLAGGSEESTGAEGGQAELGNAGAQMEAGHTDGSASEALPVPVATTQTAERIGDGNDEAVVEEAPEPQPVQVE